MLKYCFIVLALTATSSAFADPFEQPPSVTVSHADLDLSSSTGRATLERRLTSAFKRVCGEHPAATTLYEQLRARKCQSEVAGKARGEFDLAVARAVAETRLSSR